MLKKRPSTVLRVQLIAAQKQRHRPPSPIASYKRMPNTSRNASQQPPKRGIENRGGADRQAPAAR
jgi:hypothetical protein